MSLCRLQF